MARLPQPGSDKGTWGQVLNDYLAQTHNADGTLKDGSVTTDVIADGAISEDKLDTTTRGKLEGASGATDLSVTTSATTVTVASSSGDDATISAASTSDAGAMSASDKTKLNSISSGATANAADAQLRDRSTHTGTQAISTITNLQSTLDGKQAAGSYVTTGDLATVATSGDYNDLSNLPVTPTTLGGLSDVSTSGATTGQVLKYDGSGWIPAEDDTSSGGPGGATNLTISTSDSSVTIASDTGTDAIIAAATTSVAGVMSAADKTKLNGIAASATVNATDAQLRDRSTHTGTQAISTVTNLQSTLDGKAATSHTHAAADITGGVLATARLGSGTADGTTYLRGDGTWAAVASGGGATNLTISTTSTTATVLSDTGTDATIPAATATDAGVMSASDKTKLNGIAASATVNATDAQLRDRSTHTGTQAISTVTNLQSTLDGKVAVSGGGLETISTQNATGSTTLNLANGNVFNVTLTGNATFTFSGATSGKACSFSLYLRQNGTGGRTVNWPGSLKWAGGAPTLTTTANALDILVFETLDGGTTWYGSLVGANFV